MAIDPHDDAARTPVPKTDLQPLDTGHGTGIDRVTLRGVIIDERAFARWLASGTDPLAPAIGALFTGDPERAAQLLDRAAAQAAEQHGASTGSLEFRIAALRADADRDLGEFASAEATYRQLLGRAVGTSREAVLRQHLGKVYFTGGRVSEALDEFRRALALREQDSRTAPDQLESSSWAVQRAEMLLGDG